MFSCSPQNAGYDGQNARNQTKDLRVRTARALGSWSHPVKPMHRPSMAAKVGEVKSATRGTWARHGPTHASLKSGMLKLLFLNQNKISGKTTPFGETSREHHAKFLVLAFLPPIFHLKYSHDLSQQNERQQTFTRYLPHLGKSTTGGSSTVSTYLRCSYWSPKPRRSFTCRWTCRLPRNPKSMIMFLLMYLFETVLEVDCQSKSSTSADPLINFSSQVMNLSKMFRV